MILVTGATGFVGNNLVRELVRQGESVRILVRPSSQLRGLADLPIEMAKGDLMDLASLQQAMKGCRQVYHVASSIDLSPFKREQLYRVNVTGTKNVMCAAGEVSVDRLVYTSSAVTLGCGTTMMPISETSEYNLGWLNNPYIDSKKKAEELVLDFIGQGVPAVIINPGYIFGQWDFNPKLNKLLILAARGKLNFYFGGGLSVVDVADVVQGHLLAMKKGRVGERYIISNSNLTYKDFFSQINQQIGQPAPVIKFPTSLMIAMGRIAEFYGQLTHQEVSISSALSRLYNHYHYMSSEKAIKELGYKPQAIEKSLAEAFSWLAKHQFY